MKDLKYRILAAAMILAPVFYLNNLHAQSLLPAPSTVTVVGGTASVTVSWEEVAGAVDYRVYRNDQEYATGLAFWPFGDTDVISGQTYKYFVVACDADRRCGVPSNSVRVMYLGSNSNNDTSDSAQCEVQSNSTSNSVPQSVNLTTVGSIVQMTWVPPAGSVKWNVYRNDAYEFTVTNGVPAYDIENHVEGNTYSVTAIFGDGSISSQSEYASFGTGSDGSSCEEIEAQNATLTLNLSVLTENLTVTETELGACLVSLDAANETIANGDTDIADALAAQAEAEAAQAVAEQAQADAEAAAAEAEQIAMDAQAALATANAEKEAVEAANAQLAADLAAMAALLATTEADLATAQADNATLTADNQTLTENLEVATLAITQLEADLAACQAQLP